MPLDFTLAAFDEFCQRISTVPVFTLTGYLTLTAPLSPPYVIWRVDVDYRETHAVQLAQIAAAHHLHGSFYFRCKETVFPLDTIRQIAKLGHEVGYHFETLDLCRGDFAAAADLFVRHIETLRQAGFEIRTVAAHGGPPVAANYQRNLDLLTQKPELLKQVDLLGETTLSLDFKRVTYVSDARWRWRRYEGYQPGQRGQPTSLWAVARDYAQWDTGLYINFHPQQWFEYPIPMIYFRLRNRVGRLFLIALKRLKHVAQRDV